MPDFIERRECSECGRELRACGSAGQHADSCSRNSPGNYPNAFVNPADCVTVRYVREGQPDPELVEGMRELGFFLGRNPDGVDDSVAATLLVVRGLRRRIGDLDEVMRLLDDVPFGALERWQHLARRHRRDRDG